MIFSEVDSGWISLIFFVMSGVFGWLLRIELIQQKQKTNDKKLSDIEEDVKDIDRRVRDTETSIARIEQNTKNIDRNIEAIYTILDRRARKYDD